MAIGIGQQIKGMVNRARNYWSELTDGTAQRGQAGRDHIEEAVHDRYGGARDTEAEKRLRERQDREQAQRDAERESSTSLAGQSAGRATSSDHSSERSDQSIPPGGRPLSSGQGKTSPQMQADSQTQRQYTQQGGSGIQKPLNEQLGGSEDKSPGRGGGRSPGQRR